MNRIVLCAAAAFLVCSGISPAQGGFPALSEEDIPGLRIVREVSYDGASLWGYIDGGADVYLEYGFSRLLARKAEANGIRFDIDLYRMNGPESAFGIFSISAFTCSHADSLPGYHCISRYQIQAARGDYYLSIINDRGTEQADRIGLAIARRLLSRIEPADYDPPLLFELDAISAYKPSVKFIRGRLGIENGYPGWEDLFSGSGMYSVYLLPVRSDALDMALAHIIFSRKEEADNFAARAGFHTLPVRYLQRRDGDDKIRCLWRIADDRLVYLELRSDRHRADSIVGAVDKFLLPQ